MFIFYLYARVSTKEQDFSSQVIAGENFVKNYPILSIVQTIEEKCSAYNQTPSKMVQMILHIESLPQSQRPHILVKNVDRFSRSVQYGTECLDKILSLNIEILFFDYPTLNVRTVEGRNTFNVLLREAENESKRISERVISAISSKKSVGLLTSKSPPFGKKIIVENNDKKLHDDSEEIMIQSIIAMLNLDFTVKQIMDAISIYSQEYLSNSIEFYFQVESLFDSLDPTNIFYGNDEDFAYILNSLKISKRGEKWTRSSIYYQWNTYIKPNLDFFYEYILNNMIKE